MAAVTICSDFGAQENSLSVSIVSPSIICHEVMEPDAMIFVFCMLSFKPSFSLSSFTLIKRHFSFFFTFCHKGGICISEVIDLSPRVCSNSCSLSRWCHPTVSSSVAPFFSCPQSFQHQGLFQWVMPKRRGKMWKQWQTIFLGSKITADSDCSHVIKRLLLLGGKAMTNLDSVLKSRDVTFVDEGLYSQSYGFSRSHVQMWDLDH